ncbi:hypothetical protein G6L24_08470 [Agrobacterium tumefaciens]|uniref:hypothetical protein n=1 Tax=Agrobacterium tumefaciens TaxID=358 RepID=UPI002FDA5BF8|nr:hypothetical protein [Agrobacterium tumefaciens]
MPATTFRSISTLDPVPDHSKMTATQALMVQRMTERTAPFPGKVTASPEVLEGEILPILLTEKEMQAVADMQMTIREQRERVVKAYLMLGLTSRQT